MASHASTFLDNDSWTGYKFHMGVGSSIKIALKGKLKAGQEIFIDDGNEESGKADLPYRRSNH
ncbi:hypothetical protein C5167_003119 [Papaver somniferum]|uniref:Uncharacterized protein n=1 Tax=Papaver somniferum TaxID=3469 RepID=A0A4Y7L1N0_PAPSO|nr:hypothetical protein C5167_003119 [Papaver somniferum]